MNWDDLKVLLALSREGSTRKAAATLDVSNTTVMRRLESLEEQVGGRLFDRTPDGFRATSLADQLLPAAREVEEMLAEAERQVSGKDSELSGRIKLSLPAVPVTYISEAVAEFERQMISAALEQNHYNVNRSAEQLKMTRHSLRYRMQQLGLSNPGSSSGNSSDGE